MAAMEVGGAASNGRGRESAVEKNRLFWSESVKVRGQYVFFLLMILISGFFFFLITRQWRRGRHPRRTTWRIRAGKLARSICTRLATVWAKTLWERSICGTPRFAASRLAISRALSLDNLHFQFNWMIIFIFRFSSSSWWRCRVLKQSPRTAENGRTKRRRSVRTASTISTAWTSTRRSSSFPFRFTLYLRSKPSSVRLLRVLLPVFFFTEAWLYCWRELPLMKIITDLLQLILPINHSKFYQLQEIRTIFLRFAFTLPRPGAPHSDVTQNGVRFLNACV